MRLPIVVVSRRDVPIAQAAAASANFPPVFPDVAIDVDGRRRYWVTDGGAIDNRGMETLLFTVKTALREPRTGSCATDPPPIHMILADASAYSEGFRQDRAMGTAMAAGSKFASQLVREVSADVSALYYPGSFRFHDLPMPNTLRRPGAFGTHWMLQANISLQDEDGGSQVWAGEQIAGAIRALHDQATYGTQPAEIRGLVDELLSGSDDHRGLWEKIVKSLK